MTIVIVVEVATIVSYLQTPVYAGSARTAHPPASGQLPFEAVAG